MKETATPIEDYAETVGARKDLIKQFADKLPGDPAKVAAAVLRVTELAELTALVDEWEETTKEVNFPPGT